MTTDPDARPTGDELPQPIEGGGHAAAGSGLAKVALANSARLGVALVLSWILALGGRLLLPRLLGQEQYGELAFIESVITVGLTFLSFGINTYVQKEVAARREHANEIVSPLALLQLGGGVLLAALFGLGFSVADGNLDRFVLVVTFALGQVALILAHTRASYLHAVQQAKAVSIATVATKAVWFVLLLGLFGAGVELMALPLALLISETLRLLWLRRAVHQEFGRPQPARLGVAVTVVRLSLPYYMNSLNVVFTSFNVPIILGLLVSQVEVGYFAAANLVISIPMLLAPLFSWVVMPVLSRLRQQSSERMWDRVRMMIDLAIVPLFATGLVLFVIARPLVELLFGDEFTASGPVFSVLALSLPGTYLAMILGGAFVADDRGWQNTYINIVTMVGITIGSVLVLSLITHSGPGQAATRAALVMAVGEWTTVTIMAVLRPPGALAKSTVLGLLVIAAGVVLTFFVGVVGDRPELAIGIGIAIALGVTLSVLPRLLRTGRQLFG